MMRKGYIDIIKGFAIICVVFGHTTHHPFLRTYLLQSCLPLFFFVSGFLFNPDKYKNSVSFLKSKVKSLLVPYVFFYLLTFVYWLLIERRFRGGDLTPVSQLIGLFYGTYGKNMWFNGALWFLPCLFSVEMIFYYEYLVKSSVRYWLITGVVIVGSLLLQNNIAFLPFGLSNAMFFISYYTLGYLSKDKLLILESSKKMYLLVSVFIFTTFQILWIHFNFNLLSFMNDYGKDAIFALFTISMVASLSILLSKNTILEYLGRNSLVIFAFQEPVYRAVIYIYAKILKTNVELVRINIIYSVMIFLTTIIIILPAIWIYKNRIEGYLKRIY